MDKFSKKLKQYKKNLKFLKIKFFLLITLPLAIVTIGQAVIKEYTKIKVRQLASHAKPEVKETADSQDTES